MADSRWMAGLAGLLMLVAARGVAAWEIQLLGDITTQAAVVRLGDIATVQGIEPGSGEVLTQIIVAAGPTRSHRRVLTSGDVRKTLEQRGVDLRQCQFAGVSRVVVSYGSGTSTCGTRTRRFESNTQTHVAAEQWARDSRAATAERRGGPVTVWCADPSCRAGTCHRPRGTAARERCGTAVRRQRQRANGCRPATRGCCRARGSPVPERRTTVQRPNAQAASARAKTR